MCYHHISGAHDPGARSVRTTRAKPQLANVAFFVLARTFCDGRANQKSCRGIVNKPPITFIKGYQRTLVLSRCRAAVMPSTHNEIKAMTVSKPAHRAFAASSPPLSARSLNCKMPMNVDNIF